MCATPHVSGLSSIAERGGGGGGGGINPTSETFVVNRISTTWLPTPTEKSAGQSLCSYKCCLKKYMDLLG